MMIRIKSWYSRQIAIAVIFGIFIMGSIPRESMAYVMGLDNPVATASASARAADMAIVQRVLEQKLISGKLSQAGLTSGEVSSRLSKLSDEELHQFAKRIDTLYPGGDLGLVIALLIIVILVMVVLKLNDKKIIIK
ncbi:MAG: PA2779 family protein [Deltaproteobacteria bacterium]|nr:PA2779 family protein [Deltaproteobacteria bacterium]